MKDETGCPKSQSLLRAEPEFKPKALGLHRESVWLATLPPLIGKLQAEWGSPANYGANCEWELVEQDFMLCLIWYVNCPALLVMPITNIPFTMSYQIICLPILHNILEDIYRNWEIWVYRRESIWCAFSLYYILYFVSFIFFFINSLSNTWAVIYFICSLQECWIQYQNTKKLPTHSTL